MTRAGKVKNRGNGNAAGREGGRGVSTRDAVGRGDLEAQTYARTDTSIDTDTHRHTERHTERRTDTETYPRIWRHGKAQEVHLRMPVIREISQVGLRALKPLDPSLPLQHKRPDYPLEHWQPFFQAVQALPGSRGQDCGGRVGARSGGRLGTPQQVTPLCWGNVLGLLLYGGADEEGEDQPVSLEQPSAHLYAPCMCLGLT